MNHLQVIRSTAHGPQVFSTEIPGGVAGNIQTLRQMVTLVQKDVRDESLRSFVNRHVLNACRGHAVGCEIEACYRWADDNIRYRRDPFSVQRVADLATTIKERTGNCISKSVALATMLALCGLRPAFVVLAQRDWSPFDSAWEFDHVYVAVQRDGQWIELDPTPEDGKVGKRYGRPDALRRMWPIFD